MSDQEVTPVFGIDLGTTYSCIAYVDNEQGNVIIIPTSEGERTTPSVVLFENDNRVVGKEARNSAILNPDQVVEMVKQHIGDASWRFAYNGIQYSAEEISSYILRKLADDAEHYLSYPVKDVVITCPAYFSIAQRDATIRAGEIAGLNVRDVINEPTAAALMYGLQNEQDQVVLVYDLGGSTFDISVIEIKEGTITVVATGGDHNLGGRNWDEAVILYLAEQWKTETGSSDDPIDSEESLQDLWIKAEMAKQALTARQETKVVVTHAGQRIGVPLTREKFNELTANLLERTIVFTKSMMNEAESRGFTHFDQILLVGGSTKMLQIARRLREEFNLPLRLFDPDEVVAKGAALYGYKGNLNEVLGFTTDDEIPIGSNSIQPFPIGEDTQFDAISTKIRPNFFLLLGLNPDEIWNQIRFEQVIHEKRIEWSRQGSGIARSALAARRHLALLPEIQRVLLDPILREAEAKNAREEVALRRQAELGRFERELMYLNAKDYIEQSELDAFTREFWGVFSEQEIVSRVKVSVRKDLPASKPTIPLQLDASIAKDINEKLALLGTTDLYALLRRPPITTSTELYQAAEQLYIDMISRQPKTAEVTAQSDLAGYARSIFKTEESRKRYDETLHQHFLNALLKDLEKRVNRTTAREVHEKQIKIFLSEAGKAGWSEEVASARLKEYAFNHKWYLHLPSLSNQTHGQLCSYCRVMNERGRDHCSRCNEKLKIVCPNCDYLVATDEKECNECGFPVGERDWVDMLLERCREQIQKYDFRNVQDNLNEVETLWKPYKPDTRVQKLKALKAEVQKIERETSTYNVAIYGPVQGFVQGDNNTITLTFQNNYQHTIPFLAPHQPSDLIGREQLLHDLKQQLFKSESSAPSVLNGLPGVGKTALALTLAHDYEILGHFYDGILWAGLGREANIIPHLGAWAVALGISPAEIERLTMQRNQLAQAIYKAIGLRKMLLIVDDVWKIEDALAFKRGGPNCVHLITTRLPEVAAQLTNQKITLVDELDEANGLKLLEQCTPGIMTTAPEQARELVHMVGGLPLPLTLMGNYLRIHIRTGQPRRLRSALDRLQQVEERLRLKQPRDILEPYPSLPEEAPLSLRAVIQISDEALDEQTQQVLHALSLFPAKPNTFSEEAILEVAATTTDLIDKLTDSGLLEISGPDRYTLHQTISDYAKTQFNDKDAYERMVKYFIQYIKSCNGNNRLLERETSNMLAALEFMYEYEIRVDGAKAFAVFMSYLRKNRHM